MAGPVVPLLQTLGVNPGKIGQAIFNQILRIRDRKARLLAIEVAGLVSMNYLDVFEGAIEEFKGLDAEFKTVENLHGILLTAALRAARESQAVLIAAADRDGSTGER